MRSLFSFFLTATLFISSQAVAASGSCATLAKLPEQTAHHHLVIAVDQTTVVDQNLIDKFVEIAKAGIRPSTEISIYRFSAFSQGEYLRKVFSGLVDGELTPEQRYNTPKKQIALFDRCIKQQYPAMLYQTQKTLDETLNGARADLAKSDVIYSLKGLSDLIKGFSQQQTTLLIFSDMLENSALTSFYKHGSVRQIDINVEMNKVSDEQFNADFGGANIYVMGAGLVSEKGKKAGVYRNPKVLSALEGFWREWFAKSNANLQGFGMPELQSAIH
ncbi:MAG: hypothetical protein IE914_07795 [Thiotrichales bacterium]|nr:hypothetical protein [Thiotrichales bacterium]